MHKIIAIKKLIFSDEGFKILENRNALFMKGVASRFPVLPLQGPAISPLIKGIIAEEAIKLVSRKLAFLYFLSSAEIKQIVEEARIAARIERGTAMAGGSGAREERQIAAINPPA